MATVETNDESEHMLQRTADDKWWIAPDATCGGVPAGCQVCQERYAEMKRGVNKELRIISMAHTRRDHSSRRPR